MTPRIFVERLAATNLPDVFNPYADQCAVHDVPGAAAIRRKNLEHLLQAARHLRVRSLWVGRDLGYRGGRRTGLALTDELCLPALSQAFGGIPLARATRGPPVAERTAAVIWRALNEVRRPVFMWNAFPLHPHERDAPFTNRCHTASERAELTPLFLDLLEIIQPQHVVAVGKDASAALEAIGIPSVGVRHPSYGGQTDFFRGIREVYDLPEASFESRQPTFL